jgi:type IV secretion system protein VirB10
LVVYYWHRHHPQVTPTNHGRTARGAATEMRLPKLNPTVAGGEGSTVAAATAALSPNGGVGGAVGSALPGSPTGTAVPPVPPWPLAAIPNAAPGASARGTDGIPTPARHAASPVLLRPVIPVEPAPTSSPSPAPVEVAPRLPVKVLHATTLPARRFLLARGSFLDCTLETAVDSTLPGLATCVVSGDNYGSDGSVVLLPRGSRLIGETHSDVRAGQARVAITWTEARTPDGLYMPLGAAATDALGRSGVPGTVDRHTVDRFGAAVMLSVIDAGASALANRHQTGTGVVYNVQGGRDVATEALRDSIHIPPTIRVEPGARVDVIVAADVDFSEVYQLVSHGDR